MGAAAVSAAPLLSEVREAAFEGRPAFMWCDGTDVTVVIGEGGDAPSDVLKLALRCCQDGEH